jgi:hypothetical protein
MDLRNYRPDAGMRDWARYQVASSRCSETPQVAYGFEAFQEALSCFGTFQATTVPQSIACRHVTPLDRFGRLTLARCKPVRM